MFTGESRPLSHSADFFEEVFGYTPNEPHRVYVDIVDAFRVHGLAAGRTGSVPVPAAEFAGFMERAGKAGILPAWWQESVHGPDILKFVEEDEWARLDRVVSVKDIVARHGKPQAELRLRMLAERVLG